MVGEGAGDARDVPTPRPTVPRPATTVRGRILATLLSFMACGLLIAGGIAFAVQWRSVHDRIDEDLLTHVRGVETLATARAQEGVPFTSTDQLLRAATESAATGDQEAVLALTDGVPRFRPEHAQAVDLAQSSIARRIREQARPGRTVVVDMRTQDRTLRVAIASVHVQGSQEQGLFVVAADLGPTRQQVRSSLAVYIAVSALTLLAAGIVGRQVSGRLLQPISDLRRASEEISTEHLDRRVPVPDTGDDAAVLASHFNLMLERLQEGFAEQRGFLRSVGHELRTPLTIVRGTLETADPQDPDDVREAHGIALDELDRMSRLIEELSLLAAASRPDFLQLRTISLRDFGHDVLDRIRRLGEREWELGQLEDRSVDADQQRLMQAVVQLAANAVRYSDPGSRIRLDLVGRSDPEGDHIRISVQDEGIGIAPEDQDRIFERFLVAEAAKGRGGTGIGLPIVQAIAEAHGGRVELTSQPGAGSCFTLDIPQHHRQEHDPEEGPA